MRIQHRGPLTRIEMVRRLAGRELYAVSAFGLGDTLIDSCFPVGADDLISWATDNKIRRVVHTHHHEDHVGSDAGLVRQLGVEVWAPAASVSLLDDFYRLPLYRRLVWGQPGNVTAKPLGRTVQIGGFDFEVIPTPGHAPDHVCLFQRDERWLFTGDLYLSTRAKYLRAVESAGRILESLRQVAALEPRLVICSHAGFVEQGAAALRRKIRYWEGLAESAEMMARQGTSVKTITRRLLGSEGFMTFISGGAFAKRHLIASLLAMKGVYSEADRDSGRVSDEAIHSS